MTVTIGNAVGRQETARQSPPSWTGRVLHRLRDLPAKAWTVTKHDTTGVQYYTRIKLGEYYNELMLDGGSRLNSTTEEEVLKVLNEHRAKGIKLGDPRLQESQ